MPKGKKGGYSLKNPPASDMIGRKGKKKGNSNNVKTMKGKKNSSKRGY